MTKKRAATPKKRGNQAEMPNLGSAFTDLQVRLIAVTPEKMAHIHADGRPMSGPILGKISQDLRRLWVLRADVQKELMTLKLRNDFSVAGAPSQELVRAAMLAQTLDALVQMQIANEFPTMYKYDAVGIDAEGNAHGVGGNELLEEEFPGLTAGMQERGPRMPDFSRGPRPGSPANDLLGMILMEALLGGHLRRLSSKR